MTQSVGISFMLGYFYELALHKFRIFNSVGINKIIRWTELHNNLDFNWIILNLVNIDINLEMTLLWTGAACK